MLLHLLCVCIQNIVLYCTKNLNYSCNYSRQKHYLGRHRLVRKIICNLMTDDPFSQSKWWLSQLWMTLQKGFLPPIRAHTSAGDVADKKLEVWKRSSTVHQLLNIQIQKFSPPLDFASMLSWQLRY